MQHKIEKENTPVASEIPKVSEEEKLEKLKKANAELRNLMLVLLKNGSLKNAEVLQHIADELEHTFLEDPNLAYLEALLKMFTEKSWSALSGMEMSRVFDWVSPDRVQEDVVKLQGALSSYFSVEMSGACQIVLTEQNVLHMQASVLDVIDNRFSHPYFKAIFQIIPEEKREQFKKDIGFAMSHRYIYVPIPNDVDEATRKNIVAFVELFREVNKYRTEKTDEIEKKLRVAHTNIIYLRIRAILGMKNDENLNGVEKEAIEAHQDIREIDVHSIQLSKLKNGIERISPLISEFENQKTETQNDLHDLKRYLNYFGKESEELFHLIFINIFVDLLKKTMSFAPRLHEEIVAMLAEVLPNKEMHENIMKQFSLRSTVRTHSFGDEGNIIQREDGLNKCSPGKLSRLKGVNTSVRDIGEKAHKKSKWKGLIDILQRKDAPSSGRKSGTPLPKAMLPMSRNSRNN